MEQERLILDADTSNQELNLEASTKSSETSIGIFDSVSQQKQLSSPVTAGLETPGQESCRGSGFSSNQNYTKLYNEESDRNNKRFLVGSRSQLSLPNAICCCHAGHVSLISLTLVAVSSVVIAVWAILNNGMELHPLLLTISILGLVTSVIAIVFGHVKQHPWSFLPFVFYSACYVVIRIVLLVLSSMYWESFVTLVVLRDPEHSQEISNNDKQALEAIEMDTGINRLVAQWCFYIETVLELGVLGLMIYAVIAYRKWVMSK